MNRKSLSAICTLIVFFICAIVLVAHEQPKLNGYRVKLDSKDIAYIASAIGDDSERFFVVGFGFTSCPAVCPLLAAKLANVLTMTDTEVFAYFVSVDLQRDDIETLKLFTSRFHKDLVGVRFSTQSELADFSSLLKQRIYQYPDGNVDHSDMVYFFDKTRSEMIFYPNFQVDDFVLDLIYIKGDK